MPARLAGGRRPRTPNRFANKSRRIRSLGKPLRERIPESLEYGNLTSAERRAVSDLSIDAGAERPRRVLRRGSPGRRSWQRNEPRASDLPATAGVRPMGAPIRGSQALLENPAKPTPAARGRSRWPVNCHRKMYTSGHGRLHTSGRRTRFVTIPPSAGRSRRPQPSRPWDGRPSRAPWGAVAGSAPGTKGGVRGGVRATFVDEARSETGAPMHRFQPGGRAAPVVAAQGGGPPVRDHAASQWTPGYRHDQAGLPGGSRSDPAERSLLCARDDLGRQLGFV